MRRPRPRPPLRPAPAALAAVAWTVCAAGCASPGRFSAITPELPAGVRTAAEPGDDDDLEPLPATDRPDETPLPPSEPPPFDPPIAAARLSAPPPAVPAPGSAGARHDAATTAMIAGELALAPTADRAALAEEWATLDAAMVEQVIRIRRMVRQLDAKAQAPAPTPTVAPPAFDPFAEPMPGRVVPAGPHEVPAPPDGTPTSPMYDPQVRPAAYFTPADPPADGGASPLFPGLPPDPAPPAAALQTPPRRPTRVAEALPSAAALRGTYETNDPGPTGFGTEYPPRTAAAPFEDRLADLLAAAEGRVAGFAAAAERAVGDPAGRAAAEEARARAEVELRLLQLLGGRNDPSLFDRALEAVPGLPPAEQEFWQYTLWALSTEMDEREMPDAADRATHAVAALRTAAVKLSERARLTLRDVNFCHDVDSFGNVATFDRDEFSPNQRVLIYASVENFTSEQTVNGRFRTVLRSTIEIFRAGGTELIETLPLEQPRTVDLCDRHRQDYYLTFELKIPPRIGLGPHVVKLTVEDLLGDKVAQTRLNFTVR